MTECHGGNIYLHAERLGIDESAILDFSASINPLGVPESVCSAMQENMKCLFNYPDPESRRFRQKIAESEEIDPESILCGNGSTELIYLVVRALKPKRVLIPAPTFSEYEIASSRNAGADVVYHTLKEEDSFDMQLKDFVEAMAGRNGLGAPCDMAFLCNPNNPTGRLVTRTDMLKIAEQAARNRCILVVDEAFIDFCPGASIVREVCNNPSLIVLRSLTKFYALSGLRVGYAVLHPSMVETVRADKEPWTVNTLAQIAGTVALGDRAYKRETFEVIRREKQRLETGFTRLAISCLPSAANYFLLRTKKAQELATHLCTKGILVRDCSNFRGLDDSYLRVAVKSEADNTRLLEEIASCGP